MITPTNEMVYDLVVTLLIDQDSVDYDMVMCALDKVQVMFPGFDVHQSLERLLVQFEIEQPANS